jgi:two-component sensor histidine kinase
VRWRLVAENGAGAHLVLEWQESDGPIVGASSRTGYGTSVIRDLIPYELGGTANLAFPPEGIRCHLQVPARWLNVENGSRPSGDDTGAPAPVVDRRRAGSV